MLAHSSDSDGDGEFETKASTSAKHDIAEADQIVLEWTDLNFYVPSKKPVAIESKVDEEELLGKD